MNDSIVSGNVVTAQSGSLEDGSGGGIHNEGNAALSRSEVTNNSIVRIIGSASFESGYGGGISTQAGETTLTKVTVSVNSAGSGGGISSNNNGTTTINDSTVHQNSSSLAGGGIANRFNSNTTINNSTVSDNSSGAVAGGISTLNSDTTINNSTISGNSSVSGGGGVSQLGNGYLTINNSTISGNSTSRYGGGIQNSSDGGGGTILNNSTVSGNSASNGGGGIDNGNGTVFVNNSTISNNSATAGGGVYSVSQGLTPVAIILTNSIIANSTGGDLVGTATLQGVNLVEDGSVSGALSGDPQLGPLQNNGGPTETHLPADGSPVIDAGDNSVASGLATDQRGQPRFIDGPDANNVATATIDLGAVENCYLTGTLITTDQGEVSVETLQIGDLVQLEDGSFAPVKWVGHQTYDRGDKRPHPFRTYPICFKAGSLSNNLPRRDLYVTPDHAMFFDGLLINAGAMTNGTSIVQVEMDHFVYHHIELEQHSLLIAEGTPSESYLPQNQARSDFDNGDEYEELYPNHNILSLLPMSFPRVSSKRQLPRSVSKKLTQIADGLSSVPSKTKVQALA